MVATRTPAAAGTGAPRRSGDAPRRGRFHVEARQAQDGHERVEGRREEVEPRVQDAVVLQQHLASSPGATPKVMASAKLSSCAPRSLKDPVMRATRPSRASSRSEPRTNQQADSKCRAKSAGSVAVRASMPLEMASSPRKAFPRVSRFGRDLARRTEGLLGARRARPRTSTEDGTPAPGLQPSTAGSWGALERASSGTGRTTGIPGPEWNPVPAPP